MLHNKYCYPKIKELQAWQKAKQKNNKINHVQLQQRVSKKTY